MKKENHPVNQLTKLVDKKGLEALLPQNLPDAIFHRMIEEADAIEEDKQDTTPSTTILMAVLQLSSGKKLEGKMEFHMDPDELMENFNLYITLLRIEDLRRHSDIKMDESSFPTVENIFDKKREISFERIE